MRAYFIRRLLLIPPTLFGITLLVFVITRFVPGGPVERMVMEMRRGGSEGGARTMAGQNQALSEEQLDQLKEYFALDKGVIESYFVWLGVWPREDFRKKIDFPEGESVQKIRAAGTREKLEIHRDESGHLRITRPDGSAAAGWQVRSLGYKEPSPGSAGSPRIERAEIFRTRLSGVLTGDFGTSYRYNEPVIDMILERLPVSTYYGLMTLIITYLVSVPLGIAKAMHHRTWFDNASSTVVFAGYAIPHYALGALLMTWLAARLGWFPTGGFTSHDFIDRTMASKIGDVTYHSMLPLICYLVGDFAFLTMLMKNQLMDNLASDYVRTAVAKGVSYQNAVTRCATRSSPLPLTSAALSQFLSAGHSSSNEFLTFPESACSGSSRLSIAIIQL
jgi:microcin C transport system permease protein